MISRDTRFVIFVVFGFLLITSEFPGFGRFKAAMRGGNGNELASGNSGLEMDVVEGPQASSSIFVDAQWGGGYGGYGRR